MFSGVRKFIELCKIFNKKTEKARRVTQLRTLD